eukprot:TRINITY_DN596_c0_g1_i2.p1 TRINITY_DN596_c0_g1~~TRINITY_DN596_c0_g1_i2.p1  ORF type:complete len:233 (+),score=34.54 TRINITY_DN596_c0_g1_i2:63-701(+)
MCIRDRYIHACGIVHRDLKPENVLIETVLEEGKEVIKNVKLIDFGLSNIVLPGQVLQEQCGTLSHVAPEILVQSGYGKETDTWSIGVIMYFILRGKLPFEAKDRSSIIDKILNQEVTFTDEVWKDVSASAKDLIKQLLAKRPKLRITIDNAINHPWVKEKLGLSKEDHLMNLYQHIKIEDKERFDSLITKHQNTICTSTRFKSGTLRPILNA